MTITVLSQRKFYRSVERFRWQWRSVVGDGHSGGPSALICVELKVQIHHRIRDNWRIMVWPCRKHFTVMKSGSLWAAGSKTLKS